MKRLIKLALPMFMLSTAYAHDEGHGPKLGDQPKFGGVVAAVIKHEEIDQGRTAKLLYKAELTKNSEGLVRVYFYDETMKPAKIDDFSDASGTLQFRESKSKKWSSKEFSFEKKSDHFEGKLPLMPRPPFNVDITIREKSEKLFMAFDNLN